MLLDRNIFSGNEAVVSKTVRRLIVVGIAKQVIMKRPRAAWLADKMPHLIRFSIPKTSHPAAGAIGLPFAFADPTVLVKRRGKLISPLTASIVEIVIACKFQTDFVQLHRDLGSSKG